MDNKDYKNIIIEALQFIYDRCWLPCVDSYIDGETFMSMKPDEVKMLADILKKCTDEEDEENDWHNY